ncbi:hypothetical protein OC845_006918 [Tilletia horrida]|nr:hypothetical protein OC845_006918 [Tilletia horrida]
MTPIDQVFMLPLSAKLDYPTLERIVRSGHSRIPIYQEYDVPVAAPSGTATPSKRPSLLSSIARKATLTGSRSGSASDLHANAAGAVNSPKLGAADDKDANSANPNTETVKRKKILGTLAAGLRALVVLMSETPQERAERRAPWIQYARQAGLLHMLPPVINTYNFVMERVSKWREELDLDVPQGELDRVRVLLKLVYGELMRIKPDIPIQAPQSIRTLPFGSDSDHDLVSRKILLYPNSEQREWLNRAAGVFRCTYNRAIRYLNNAGNARDLTSLRRACSNNGSWNPTTQAWALQVRSEIREQAALEALAAFRQVRRKIAAGGSHTLKSRKKRAGRLSFRIRVANWGAQSLRFLVGQKFSIDHSGGEDFRITHDGASVFSLDGRWYLRYAIERDAGHVKKVLQPLPEGVYPQVISLGA